MENTASSTELCMCTLFQKLSSQGRGKKVTSASSWTRPIWTSPKNSNFPNWLCDQFLISWKCGVDSSCWVMRDWYRSLPLAFTPDCGGVSFFLSFFLSFPPSLDHQVARLILAKQKKSWLCLSLWCKACLGQKVSWPAKSIPVPFSVYCVMIFTYSFEKKTTYRWARTQTVLQHLYYSRLLYQRWRHFHTN